MVTPKIIKMARRMPIQSCQAERRLVLELGVAGETGVDVELVRLEVLGDSSPDYKYLNSFILIYLKSSLIN